MLNARIRALTARSKQVRTEQLVSSVISVQRKTLEAARRKLQQYPPVIPTSRYVRTFNLQRGWQISGPNSGASGITGRLVNIENYSRFVQGPDQVAIHQGRWLKLDEALDREQYHSDLRAVIKSLIIR